VHFDVKVKYMKKKTRKTNNTLTNIFIIFSFFIAMVFMYMTLMSYLDKKDSIAEAEQLKELYYTTTNTPSSNSPLPSTSLTPTIKPTIIPTPTPSIKNTPGPTMTKGPDVNESFIDLLQINKDVVGWISIPGTHIDYPVLQGDDNAFYLKRDIYKKKTRAASIFMDYRNNIVTLSKNTIIYGHNLDDGTMFSDLVDYVDDKVRYDFIKQYNIIIFNSIYKDMRFEVFSAYVENVDDFQYLQTNFKDENDFMSYIDTVINLSLINTKVKINPSDKIITLSTCNHWFLNSRTVIHARLITD